VVAASNITEADAAEKVASPPVTSAGVRGTIARDDEEGDNDGNIQRPPSRRRLNFESDDEEDSEESDNSTSGSSGEDGSKSAGGLAEASRDTDAAETLAVDLSGPTTRLRKRTHQSLAEAPLSRPSQKKRRLAVPDFDDECGAPIAERDPAAPSLVPSDSPVFSLLQPEEHKVIFASAAFDESDHLSACMMTAHIEALRHAGYTVVPNVVPDLDEAGRAKMAITRAGVDELFGHFGSACGDPKFRCCVDSVPCFVSIRNDNDKDRGRAKRMQTSNEALEHVRLAHAGIYKLKIRLDMAASIVLDNLGIQTSHRCTYSAPRLGGRILLSLPGCLSQKPHTDFEVRTEGGRCVIDPSYFTIQTGSEKASLLVWPASHHLCALFEHMLTEKDDSAQERARTAAAEKAEVAFTKPLKPQRVEIPPYSIFVGRGDLVHAGDSATGDSPALRSHMHCTSSNDKALDAIHIRPFGEE
jgi:hypothetical protein